MRILITDPEYLIALEVERILTETLSCKTVIAMPRELSAVLVSETFDLIVIDESVVRDPNLEVLLRAASSRIVFLSLDSEDVTRIADWPEATIVSKPFDDRKVVDAVKNAAHSPVGK